MATKQQYNDLFAALSPTPKKGDYAAIKKILSENPSEEVVGAIVASNIVPFLGKAIQTAITAGYHDESLVEIQTVTIAIGRSGYATKIAKDQYKAAWDIVKEGLKVKEHATLFEIAADLFFPDASTFSKDPDVYTLLAKGLANKEPLVKSVYNATHGLLRVNDDWRLRFSKDTQLIKSVLELHSDLFQLWVFLVDLIANPEAKTVLPISNIQQVAITRTEKFANTAYVFASLCDETNVGTFKLPRKYIDGWLEEIKKVLHGTDAQVRLLAGIGVNLNPLVNLSVADAYKTLLGEAGAVEVMVEIMGITVTKETNSLLRVNVPRNKLKASRILWNLAFKEENRKRIEAVKGLDVFRAVQTDDAELKRNIEGIIYMFEKEKKDAKPSAPVTTSNDGKHIMLSYNWGSQPMVKKIAQGLKDNGYKVWLDLDQMAGSTLVAMAEAVENSAMVLICATQKYKDSPNCRLEGEYCMNRRIDFIPLLMQADYRADGWLGLVMGSRKFYEFVDDQHYNQNFSELLREIGSRGKLGASGSLGSSSTIVSSPPATPPQPSAATWTDKELNEWLKKEGFDYLHKTFVDNKITGKSLLELKHLLTDKSGNCAQFYKVLSDIGINTVGEQLSLAYSIRKFTS